MAKKWRKSNHFYPNNQEMTIKNRRQQFPFHLFYEKFLGLLEDYLYPKLYIIHYVTLYQ